MKPNSAQSAFHHLGLPLPTMQNYRTTTFDSDEGGAEELFPNVTRKLTFPTDQPIKRVQTCSFRSFFTIGFYILLFNFMLWLDPTRGPTEPARQQQQNATQIDTNVTNVGQESIRSQIAQQNPHGESGPIFLNKTNTSFDNNTCDNCTHETFVATLANSTDDFVSKHSKKLAEFKAI
jgi:hypothetical protein